MEFRLECDICGRAGGEYATDKAWENGARRLGWAVGRDEVICRQCLARAEPPV